MAAVIMRADARSLPLPDACVDLIVTSPPYFGLRSYTDGGEHYEGQIGSEETPREWLAALWACTAEWMRVLKPGGSIFVNLGDKYSDRGHGPSRGIGTGRGPQATHLPQTRGPLEKSLLGLPWRYAIGCVDDLGLILRAEIIWAKPNGLPESVTDRVRRSHEQVFHFTKQPRYYAAVDEIREAHTGTTHSQSRGTDQKWQPTTLTRGSRSDGTSLNPLGKLPGSVWEIHRGEPIVRLILRAGPACESEREPTDDVWSIPSQPLTVPAHLGVDHFAAFPMELPRRIILGWSPPGICTACGEGRRPVTTADAPAARAWALAQRGGRSWHGDGADPKRALGVPAGDRNRTITGYACACPDATAPTRPATVVDPFGGAGTTALVAAMLGRLGFSFDLSADYGRLARWRVTDPAERAKALQVPKPPPVPDGQESLFEALL